MGREQLVKRSQVPAPAERVFGWYTRPGAFERLAPPWEPIELVEQSGGVQDGTRTVFSYRLGPLRKRWVAEHRDCIAGRQFRDVQVEGPFAYWQHTHLFEPYGPNESFLEDRIEYELPLGSAGRVASGSVRRRLTRALDYRHRVTIADLKAHERFREAGTREVAVSGSTGLVGSAIVPLLTTGGHRVRRLMRPASGRPVQGETIEWDIDAGRLDTSALEGIDAVIHLAGESIAGGRWTAAKKARILESRVNGTRLLSETLARLARPPRVLLCASAIGFYGDRGDELLDENSRSGSGFLAEVCRQWEAATEPAAQAGIRVVNLRFGVILSPAGGALAKMLTPFKLGAGGRLGDGLQYMSWIALDDAAGAMHHALFTESLAGPVNVVAPTPVTNAEFTATLGRVLRRPTIAPMPAFAARLAFGEMADELLLSSTHVSPARLAAAGYPFRFELLESALRHLLGK